jgi:hypothetical protein
MMPQAFGRGSVHSTAPSDQIERFPYPVSKSAVRAASTQGLDGLLTKPRNLIQFHRSTKDLDGDLTARLRKLTQFSKPFLRTASSQGNRRSLLGSSGGGKKGHKNNQAAQAIDQSKFPFGGGIQQGQAGM